jgi:3-hydroxyisobutyrate dehydrogenase
MTISVGVIGIGALGEPIAGLLLKAGFAVSACDVRREPVERLAKLGARPCMSAAQVARHSDLVVSLVLDAKQTMDVVFGESGLLGAIRPVVFSESGASVAATTTLANPKSSSLTPEPVIMTFDGLRSRWTTPLA